jgi:hypothetical protein
MIQVVASVPRLRILLACWPTAKSARELGDALDLTPSVVRHQAAVLESAGLLDHDADGFRARSDWQPIVDALEQLQPTT